MKKIVKNIVPVLLSCLFVINNNFSQTTNAFYVKQLTNYPTYLQSSHECWAYSILSMANYVYGGYSIDDVIYAYNSSNLFDYGWDGATYNQAYNTIEYIFSEYSPTKKGCLTSNEIKIEINAGFPVYIRGGDRNASGGHAVALMGYKSPTASSSVSMIYYMNPATNSIMFSGYLEGGSNTFRTNDTLIFDWENSIII